MGSMDPNTPSQLPPSSSSCSSPGKPPPVPAPAAIPFHYVNSSGDSPTQQPTFGSDNQNGDDPPSASGGTAPMVYEDDSKVPLQETSPESTYTPSSDTLETQVEQQESLENAEKLNEPVQESSNGEGTEHEEVEQGVMNCMGDNGAPDNTFK